LYVHLFNINTCYCGYISVGKLITKHRVTDVLL
jgi:hypothetical protein